MSLNLGPNTGIGTQPTYDQSQQMKSVLGLGNVEDVSLSDWTGSNNLRLSASQIVDFSSSVQELAAVRSVSGRTGVVTLSSGDVGLWNVVNIDATNRNNHTGTQSVSTISGLGTVATAAITDFATAAQGVKADTALQTPGTNIIGGVLTATGASTKAWVKPFKRFHKLAPIGDSIIQNNSGWLAYVFLGVYPNGIGFTARSAFTDTANISIASVIAGNNTPLSIVVTGKAVTINLATNGAGVSTSTNALVKAALDASIPFQDLGISTSFFLTGSDLFAVSGTNALTARPLAISSNYAAKGYITYAQNIMNGRFDYIRRPISTNFVSGNGDWTFGVSGATSSSVGDNPGVMGDMLAQAVPVGATVLESSGSNDAQNGGTAASIFGYRKALWDTIEGEGLQMIACEIAPLGISSSPARTLAQAQAQTVIADAANALCKAEAQSRGMLWVEWPGSLRASSAASNVYFTDGTHPNDLGAQIMGATLADALDPYVSKTKIFMPPEGSKKWLSANPQMRGGATVATSWNAATGPGGGSNVMSKQTIGSETWQRITVTQSGTYNLCLMSCNATTVTAGQRIRIMGRVKVSDGFRNVHFRISFNNNGGAISSNLSYEVASMTSTLTAWEGTLVSGFDTVPFGVTTATISVYTYGAGTVDFRDLGIVEE